MKVKTKTNLSLITTIVLSLAGCYGKIGTTNIEFQNDTLQGPKSLVAYAKPGQNTVRDVEIDLSGTLAGQPQELGTIPFKDQQGNPIIQQQGNKFSLGDNPLLDFLGLNDSVTATWRFTFGGAAFTPEHVREKTFNYVAQITDVAILEEIEFIDSNGEVIEPTNVNNLEKVDIVAGQPITINIKLRNVHPNNPITNFVPVRIQEQNPGGSVPNDPQDLTRNYFGGIAVNEIVEFSFANVSFNAPSQGEGSFRQLSISVNTPPAPVNGALLEENTNNNFYIPQQIIEILPQQ